MKRLKRYYLQVYRHSLSLSDEDTWVSLDTLEIHPEMAQRLADLGIMEIRQGRIPARQAGRLQKLMRLRRNLGVNLPGAAIILDLLEQIEVLREEIEKLSRR